MKLDGFLGNLENFTDLPVRLPLFAPFEAGDFLRRQERAICTGYFTRQRLPRDGVFPADGRRIFIELRSDRSRMDTTLL
ncbi:hypothetical protein Q2941_26195 [Bradyrhizobium sp. UFLA05-153]